MINKIFKFLWKKEIMFSFLNCLIKIKLIKLSFSDFVEKRLRIQDSGPTNYHLKLRKSQIEIMNKLTFFISKTTNHENNDLIWDE